MACQPTAHAGVWKPPTDQTVSVSSCVAWVLCEWAASVGSDTDLTQEHGKHRQPPVDKGQAPPLANGTFRS